MRKGLGAPDILTSLEDVPNEEAWLYLEGAHRATRLSLIFDKSSDLQKSKELFGGSRFQLRKAPMHLSYVIPDEAFLSNEELGLEIEYAQSTEKVESITWTVPAKASVTVGD